nr:DNA primase [Saprospiraceae bacterium]
MISSKKIDKIFDTLQIEEIIEDFVSLKKRGTNLLGLCPFHNEKTPSFTVSPSKGIFKCFGCGKGGNAIHFLMEHENFTYPEALKYAADKYGITIEEEVYSPEQQEKEKERASLYIVNEFAKKFFKSQLLKTGEGKSVGLEYFEGRGYDLELIEKFDLGYAPRSGNALKSAALRAGHELDRIKALGLVSTRGNDFFRERVMFTIHNLSGKPIAFAGRMLGENKKMPKYINSPETDIYNKSEILYGIYQARQAIRKENHCLLVEGYTDVISLHKYGIENVVAVSGTSLTPGQTRLIKRFTRQATLIFDGDPAGIKAADRSIDLLLEQELNAKVVILDSEDDPDSAVKKMGKDGFLEFIEKNQQDFLEFKISHLYDKASDDPFEKSKAIKEIVKTLSLISDQLSRSLFVTRAANLLSIPEDVIIGEVNKALRSKMWEAKGRGKREREKSEQRGEISPKSPSAGQSKVGTQDYFQEEALIQLLLKFGNETLESGELLHQYVFEYLEDVYDTLNDRLVLKMLSLIKTSLEKNGKINTHDLINTTDKDVSELAVQLISEEYEYSENWQKRWNIVLQNQKSPEENYELDAEQILVTLKLRKVRRVIKEVIQGLTDTPADGSEQTNENLEVYMELKNLEQKLAKKLRTIVYG